MYATNILDTTHDTGTAAAIAPAELDNLTIDTKFDEMVHDELHLDDLASEGADVPVILRTPQARCADGHGTLTHLFFSDVPLDTARAKAICGKCKLATTCLDGALERAEPWGVWGGELIENGRVVVNKRPRGRPPKHPRPVLVIDEVPIPPHLVA
jgi:hypothetical protein